MSPEGLLRIAAWGYAAACLRSIVFALVLLFHGDPLPIEIPQGDMQTLAPPRGYNRAMSRHIDAGPIGERLTRAWAQRYGPESGAPPAEAFAYTPSGKLMEMARAVTGPAGSRAVHDATEALVEMRFGVALELYTAANDSGLWVLVVRP